MEAPLPVFKTTVFQTLSCTVDNWFVPEPARFLSGYCCAFSDLSSWNSLSLSLSVLKNNQENWGRGLDS
jgi:hypothetical protein